MDSHQATTPPPVGLTPRGLSCRRWPWTVQQVLPAASTLHPRSLHSATLAALYLCIPWLLDFPNEPLKLGPPLPDLVLVPSGRV